MLVSITKVLAFVVCTSKFLMTATGQPPTAEKKGEKAKSVAGPKNVTDKDRLQGKWQVVSIAFDDKVIKREGVPQEWKDTFEKELFVEGDRFGQVGNSNASINLDETRDPKRVTIQDADGKLTFRGIYSLDGDSLKVCMNGDGSDVRRPEEFVIRKGTPLLLILLKKAPADKK